MKTINLPPYAPTLIESTRAMGYSLESAVADIIDNSIAAFASKVDLFFFPVDGEYIAFLDNGEGMTSEELNMAMQYGSKNPLESRDQSDLGRFGLGLKTASLSQCKMLTVISKSKEGIEARRWDVDYVAETGEWSLIVLDDSEIQECPHFFDLDKYDKGTLVIWQKLDRLKAGETNFEQTMGRKMDDVRDHLSLVFHRYLFGEKGIKKLQILMNNQPVQPIDPFLTSKSTQAMDDEIMIVQGEKIVVRPYILPHTSKMTADELNSLGGKDGLRRQQGFYVYRNKRLLVWGTWFRMMRQGEMSKLVRIRVDIPNALDDLWTLDIKKSSAVPPAAVRSNLRVVIEKMSDKSKRTWTVRGKKEIDDKAIHVWNRLRTRNGGYIYQINRHHPLAEELLKNTEVSKQVEALLKQIENNIPLNALYVDLTNDVKIDNDVGEEYKDIRESMIDILHNTAPELQESMINNLVSCEPFVAYKKELLQEFMDGVLNDKEYGNGV